MFGSRVIKIYFEWTSSIKLIVTKNELKIRKKKSLDPRISNRIKNHFNQWYQNQFYSSKIFFVSFNRCSCTYIILLSQVFELTASLLPLFARTGILMSDKLLLKMGKIPFDYKQLQHLKCLPTNLPMNTCYTTMVQFVTTIEPFMNHSC